MAMCNVYDSNIPMILDNIIEMSKYCVLVCIIDSGNNYCVLCVCVCEGSQYYWSNGKPVIIITSIVCVKRHYYCVVAISIISNELVWWTNCVKEWLAMANWRHVCVYYYYYYCYCYYCGIRKVLLKAIINYWWYWYWLLCVCIDIIEDDEASDMMKPVIDYYDVCVLLTVYYCRVLTVVKYLWLWLLLWYYCVWKWWYWWYCVY